MKGSQDFYSTQARHTRQCRREALWTAGVWFAGLIFCGVAFGSWGYLPIEARPAQPPTVWGFPAWAFWGLLVPWVVLIGATWFFAAFVLRDDEPYQEFPLSKPSQPGSDEPRSKESPAAPSADKSEP